MIISDQQVRLALDYLHTQNVPSDAPEEAAALSVTPELIERVRRQIEAVPELRDDRVAEARLLMAAEGVSADEVACKMVGRILSDSIR